MTTRQPLTEAEKAYLAVGRAAGATYRCLARELHCASETVRKHARRQRDHQVVRARGRPAHGILSTYPRELVERAVAVKRAHPHWGPANVRLELSRSAGVAVADLPSPARLSALFKARCPEAVQPHHHQHYPERPVPHAEYAHQRWQMDAQEKVPLSEQRAATILNVRDPVTAVMIASQAFLTTTAQGTRKLTLAEVQGALRAAFAQWGCPLEIQTDHEDVYVGAATSDFPSRFTLWLRGLNIQHVTSRSHHPTDQAQVERGHRTLSDMTWKDETFAQVTDLQAALDDRRQRYNTQLPVTAADCDGQPPLTVHPSARFSGRPFQPELEWKLFDLKRVDAFLAQQVWIRHVGEQGQLGVGATHYYLGRKQAFQTVTVRFQPLARVFRFESAAGMHLADMPARELDQADLIGYAPLTEGGPLIFQFPLPLAGV
jgi:transposase InsO family protein